LLLSFVVVLVEVVAVALSEFVLVLVVLFVLVVAVAVSEFVLLEVVVLPEDEVTPSH
jgi:hypothetical protein